MSSGSGEELLVAVTVCEPDEAGSWEVERDEVEDDCCVRWVVWLGARCEGWVGAAGGGAIAREKSWRFEDRMK